MTNPEFSKDTKMSTEDVKSPHDVSRTVWLYRRVLWYSILFSAVYAVFCFFANWYWLPDLAVNFRVQVAMLTGIVFILCLISRKFLLVTCSLVVLMINAGPLMSYAIPNNLIPVGIIGRGFSLRIMSVNVLTENERYDRFVEMVKREDPDIIAVLEVNQVWGSELAELVDDYPYQKILPREDNFGIGILSKFPFSDFKLIDGLESGPPIIHCKLLVNEEAPYEIIAVHPIPPLSLKYFKQRNRQLISAAKLFEQPKRRIMLGDFNMTPWSPAFQEILAAGELKDSSKNKSFFSTWYPAGQSWVGLKLDHILVSSDLNDGEFRVSKDFGSDHRAVMAVLGGATFRIKSRP